MENEEHEDMFFSFYQSLSKGKTTRKVYKGKVKGIQTEEQTDEEGRQKLPVSSHFEGMEKDVPDVIHLLKLFVPSRCFVFEGALRNHMLAVVQNHFHYRRFFFDLAARAILHIGDYSCAHVTNFVDDQEQRLSLNETHIIPMLEFVEKGSIFIATDDKHVSPVRQIFQNFFPKNKVVMWQDLLHLYNDHRKFISYDPTTASVLQQIVCAHANQKFYPTVTSHYSVYITKLRQILRTGKTNFGGIVNLEVPKALWF